MGRSRYVKRRRDGRYDLNFPDQVRSMLVDLAGQLDDILDGDGPELRRLFPVAYAQDAELDAGYQVLARGELIDQRRSAITDLRQTAEADDVSEEELTSWMTVINDLRLVFGTILDVSEDDESEAEFLAIVEAMQADEAPDGGAEGQPPELDRMVAMRMLYEDLGFVLSHIVDALVTGLPD